MPVSSPSGHLPIWVAIRVPTPLKTISLSANGCALNFKKSNKINGKQAIPSENNFKEQSPPNSYDPSFFQPSFPFTQRSLVPRMRHMPTFLRFPPLVKATPLHWGAGRAEPAFVRQGAPGLAGAPFISPTCPYCDWRKVAWGKVRTRGEGRRLYKGWEQALSFPLRRVRWSGAVVAGPCLWLVPRFF